MKDVVLVTAYTPDEERLELLSSTINFLYSNNKDIILVTHSTNTPENIVKKCKYFLYSSENKLLDYEEMKMFLVEESSGLRYGSKLTHEYKYTTLAIYNMILLGSTIAKNLGYDILHYVEYDSDFSTTDLFELCNSKINEGFDSVIIIDDSFQMYGGFKTISLNSYDFQDLIYDEEKLIPEAKKHIITEQFTKNFFLKDKKIYNIDYNDVPNYGYNYCKYKHSNKKGYFTFPLKVGNEIRILYSNHDEVPNELMVIVNDTRVIKSIVNGKTFRMFPISNYDDIKKITIIINDKLIATYNMETTEQKDYILNQSFVYEI